MIPEVYEETDKDVGFNYTAVRWQVRDQRLKIKDQLSGMHGSGLTHLLFLPDWAAIFEM